MILRTKRRSDLCPNLLRQLSKLVAVMKLVTEKNSIPMQCNDAHIWSVDYKKSCLVLDQFTPNLFPRRIKSLYIRGLADRDRTI
ncbi:hypothetical protein UPYG_G00175090 [Umbra pygmaea]|uniref:Uncharacterized protein n=1 Tax=Umbra pygmaea TaxID=75934 RepID=A0ABD0WQC9_UMBPY